MRKLATVVLLCAVAFTAPFAAGTAAAYEGVAEGEQRWRFQVLLDEREIGFHDFVVDRRSGRARVETVAEFDVRFLFINAYSYRHQNVEIWENGCLASIQSQTDDNGERLQVAGAPSEDGFRVDSRDGETTLASACIRTFAYWNPEALQADRLLNSQTGEWVEVEVRELGPAVVPFQDAEIPARHLRILMPEGRIDLWYHRETGQWLALESPTESGRVLRYVPAELPLAASGQRLTLN